MDTLFVAPIGSSDFRTVGDIRMMTHGRFLLDPLNNPIGVKIMDSTGVYPVISADTTWLSCCGVKHDISMFWGSEKSGNCLIKSNLMADTVSSLNFS